MQIIDCHVHLNNYEVMGQTKQKFMSIEERLNALLHLMDTNDIIYSIVLSSYRVDSNRPSTSEIIDIVNKNENISNRIGVVTGFAIDNHTDEDFKKYRKWLKDRLIIGIKLYCGYEHYYPYDKRYQRIYDLCVEYEIPVMIHTGDAYSSSAKLRYAHPLNVDDVAVENPELRIIMCHLGNPWIDDCQEVLYKNRNVYADISGLVVGAFNEASTMRYVDQIDDLLSYTSQPHHLLYGSDWPISDMSSYLAFAQKLNLNKDPCNLLMYGNAKYVFRL
jgi:predicted TIM-barrel fold metal-dependent hydrolase